jgi:putative isomerase
MSMNYSLENLAFSRYGAWFGVVTRDAEALARKISEGSLFLRSYHFRNSTFLELVPMYDGECCDVDAAHDGAVLTLSNYDGRIELCFASDTSLRIRGVGLGLCLKPLAGVAFPSDKNAAILNVKEATRSYRIEALQGTLESDGYWTGDSENRVASSIDVTSSDEGVFDVVIDEFQSTWRASPRLLFSDCKTQAREELEAWLRKVPNGPEQYVSTTRMAGYYEWASVVSPCGHIKRDVMFMSKHMMANIWCWDNCFNAIAMAAPQPELAMGQLLAFVDHQDEHGAYPDVYNDSWMLFNYCKPPIHGWTLFEMLKRKPDLPLEFLNMMYSSLSRWTRWWLDNRRLAGQKLPFYLHGNDSGWDNGTLFDKGTPLLSPDAAAFLVVQLDALADLCEMFGKEEGVPWRRYADEIQEALMNELWDGHRFVGKHAITGAFVESNSLLSYMPLLLGKRLNKDVAAKVMTGLEDHLTEWGLATEVPGSPKYEPDGYWRGPIWAPSTYLIVAGLDRCGYGDLGDDIARRFCNLCAKSGFAENFNAITGEPLRDPAYTWTSSVFLLLAERLSNSHIHRMR